MITAEQEKRHRQGWKPEEVRRGGWVGQGKRQQREDNVKKYKVAAENGKRKGNAVGEEIGGTKKARRCRISVCRQHSYNTARVQKIVKII